MCSHQHVRSTGLSCLRTYGHGHTFQGRTSPGTASPTHTPSCRAPWLSSASSLHHQFGKLASSTRQSPAHRVWLTSHGHGQNQRPGAAWVAGIELQPNLAALPLCPSPKNKALREADGTWGGHALARSHRSKGGVPLEDIGLRRKALEDRSCGNSALATEPRRKMEKRAPSGTVCSQGKRSHHTYTSVSKVNLVCPVVESAQAAVTEPPNTK